MSKSKSVVSFGGGVNSTALLVGLYEREERPDAVLFADTGGERPETYQHVRRMSEWCVGVGFPEIVTVSKGITLEQDCLDRETLPSKAFGFPSCSDHFKVRPQKKWIAESGWKDVVWLIGIHKGEIQRAKKNTDPFVRFPLIEWGWGQEDCVDAIRCNGLPIPPKSACFFCPSMKKQEILELKRDNPELFERAVEMERNAKEAGTLTTTKGLGRRFSWESLAKADEAQLRLPIFDDSQPPICDVCIDW
ncbi:Phosphoadenosine phosphosulfate reductase family protein [Pirellula sp. SH-Sr6A]|uniref:phosphoadenosine phosphosulfate reductase domain-containing protein n=1 Tax=Pirellula sp. SH-Sr6A TaxID=1632865 RepID=UPI00078BAE04|nr:phosphoadenosine phosphosulfate reductase family protein [Pirellula sp. SH-Sr6A]AMV31307.1 Phosphoadenosine phosphosulfate reductase family protein [Pirellula sp. SH-Sr6A]